jgi:hypothetical protein
VEANDPTERRSADAAVQRLESLIERYVEALSKPGDAPFAYVPPKTPITAVEAGGFFRAVDAGLFDLREDGMCRPQRMRPSTGYCYPLLWASKSENRVTLWREWLTHAAAPAMLHLDYGYPLHDIALDIDAFDVLVYSRLNQAFIAVEAKKSLTELENTPSPDARARA